MSSQFVYFSWKTWPNTLKCHQLIAYLTDPNRQADNKPSSSECNAAIFDAMYERGENVSLTDTLVKIATNQLGVSESEADQLRAHLESNAGSKAVVKEIQEGRKKYNISGVPFFVIGASRNGQYVGRPYGFSGAQRRFSESWPWHWSSSSGKNGVDGDGGF
jgi:predicted DsbA family dithiol-disulfide isomerase